MANFGHRLSRLGWRQNRCLTCSGQESRPEGRTLPPVIWKYISSGHVRYQTGLEFQEKLVRHKIDNPQSPDWLILLQHQAVYTTGRRETEKNVLEIQRNRLKVENPEADYVSTLRGGQTTYHGPGQLVGYPIINLGRMGLSARCYVDMLMKMMRSVLIHPALPSPIETLDPGQIPDLPVGTFVGSPKQKIASIGVQIRRRITSHGFAINVEDRSEIGFHHIIPCGLTDIQLISIQNVLNQPIKVENLIQPVVEVWSRLTDRDTCEMSTIDSQALDPIGYQLVQDLVNLSAQTKATDKRHHAILGSWWDSLKIQV